MKSGFNSDPWEDKPYLETWMPSLGNCKGSA